MLVNFRTKPVSTNEIYTTACASHRPKMISHTFFKQISYCTTQLVCLVSSACVPSSINSILQYRCTPPRIHFSFNIPITQTVSVWLKQHLLNPFHVLEHVVWISSPCHKLFFSVKSTTQSALVYWSCSGYSLSREQEILARQDLSQFQPP